MASVAGRRSWVVSKDVRATEAEISKISLRNRGQKCSLWRSLWRSSDLDVEIHLFWVGRRCCPLLTWINLLLLRTKSYHHTYLGFSSSSIVFLPLVAGCWPFYNATQISTSFAIVHPTRMIVVVDLALCAPPVAANGRKVDVRTKHQKKCAGFAPALL